MPKFLRLPEAIEACEFDPDEPHGGLPSSVVVRMADDGGYEIYNEIHRSFIGVSPGDMVRVDRGAADVYPISREVFDRIYRPLGSEEEAAMENVKLLKEAIRGLQ